MREPGGRGARCTPGPTDCLLSCCWGKKVRVGHLLVTGRSRRRSAGASPPIQPPSSSQSPCPQPARRCWQWCQRTNRWGGHLCSFQLQADRCLWQPLLLPSGSSPSKKGWGQGSKAARAIALAELTVSQEAEPEGASAVRLQLCFSTRWLVMSVSLLQPVTEGTLVAPKGRLWGP